MARTANLGRRTPYVETFDDGPGGWCSWGAPHSPHAVIRDGAFYTRGPWRVDPNHPPPGGGYLHLLAYLHTSAERLSPGVGPNRFVDEGYSRDLTNAQFTVRLRGDVELRGAELVLWAQAELDYTTANYALVGQPFRITPDWSEQTVTLEPDETQWVCTGAHHEQAYRYGCGPIADALRDCDVDLILVLYPLTIVPTEPVDDLNYRRCHRDYQPDYRHLPSGELEFDTIRINYPD